VAAPRVTLAFTVYGLARTKGNHRAIHVKGMKFPIVTESNRNVASWQQLVAAAASQAIATAPAAERGLITGGVRVTVGFYLQRPRKFGKRGVFVHHTVKPDLDRLERAILDALTAIAYHDDKQVTEIVTGKYYAGVDEPARVNIRVEPAPPGRTGVHPITMPLFEAAG
jgi:crossover junction endodeoxyribonuclease RusA